MENTSKGVKAIFDRVFLKYTKEDIEKLKKLVDKNIELEGNN